MSSQPEPAPSSACLALGPTRGDSRNSSAQRYALQLYAVTLVFTFFCILLCLLRILYLGSKVTLDSEDNPYFRKPVFKINKQKKTPQNSSCFQMRETHSGKRRWFDMHSIVEKVKKTTVFLLSQTTVLLPLATDRKLDTQVLLTVKMCRGFRIRDPALTPRPSLWVRLTRVCCTG